jgi:hypothetical protein
MTIRNAQSTKPLLELSRTEVSQRIDRAIQSIQQIEELLAGLETMSVEERKRTIGKLREGELSAMHAVLDAADARPDYFLPLATRDFGVDDEKFETAPARTDLQNSQALLRVEALLVPLAQRVSDTILSLNARARSVTMPAYKLAQIAAVSDRSIRSRLAPALTFYGKPSRTKAANRRRQARKTKPAA